MTNQRFINTQILEQLFAAFQAPGPRNGRATPVHVVCKKISAYIVVVGVDLEEDEELKRWMDAERKSVEADVKNIENALKMFRANVKKSNISSRGMAPTTNTR